MDASLAALPRDVLAQLFGLLTSFDLLALSHTNRRFFATLLPRDADEWRVAAAASPSPKESCFRSRSIRFQGRRRGPPNKHYRGAACDFPLDQTLAWYSGSFSLDFWFALLPGPSAFVGGILFGGQGAHCFEAYWRELDCEQFVLVNDRRELACSMLRERPVVKTDLELERWYHVALTYAREEGENAQATQHVYVDGELVHKARGALHPVLIHLAYLQIGTGCVADDEFTHGIHEGWYGLNGVVDDFRVWGSTLSEKHVQELAKGYQSGKTSSVACLMWSIRSVQPQWYGPIERISCTRPRERVCVTQWNGDDCPLAKSLVVPAHSQFWNRLNAFRRWLW